MLSTTLDDQIIGRNLINKCSSSYLTILLSGKNGCEKVSFEPNATTERPQSAAGQRRPDLTESDLEKPPFMIEPTSGHVLVGQQQEFKVTYSPLDCVTSEGWLDCRLVTIL